MSTQNEEGKAQFAKYERNESSGSGRLNQLNLASKLQNTVGNMAYNGSFEAVAAWATNPGCPYGPNWDFTLSDHYLGNSCIYMTPPSNGAMVIARPFTEDCYPVQPGHTYTLSAYVKTINMTSGGGGGAQIGIGPISSTTASVVSDSIKSNTNGWTRLEVATQYDNDGNIGIVKDSAGNRIKYYYDALNRLMRYDESGSGYNNTAQWRYDEKNNLSSQTQNISGTVYTTGYTYDNDNRLTSSSQGGVTTGYTYAADGTGRLTQMLTKNGTASVVTTNIGYVDSSTTSTTAQVKTWNVDAPGTAVDKTYSYTYDSHGNILTVTGGGTAVSYVYDGLDQLVRENNQAAGKTWTYTYNAGGNITAKREYAYTTGALGTVLSTVNYGYGDSTWKDLLTSYNGQAITSTPSAT